MFFWFFWWMLLLGFGMDFLLKMQFIVCWNYWFVYYVTRPCKGSRKSSETGKRQDKCKVGMDVAASEFKVEGPTLVLFRCALEHLKIMKKSSLLGGHVMISTARSKRKVNSRPWGETAWLCDHVCQSENFYKSAVGHVCFRKRSKEVDFVLCRLM